MSDILSQFKALKLHGMAECYAELQAQGQAGTSEDIGSTAWLLRQSKTSGKAGGLKM
jgi:hypothetical protein